MVNLLGILRISRQKKNDDHTLLSSTVGGRIIGLLFSSLYHELIFVGNIPVRKEMVYLGVAGIRKVKFVAKSGNV